MKKKRKFVTFPIVNIKNLAAVLSSFIILTVAVSSFGTFIFQNINVSFVNTVLNASVKRTAAPTDTNIARAMLSFSIPTLVFNSAVSHTEVLPQHTVYSQPPAEEPTLPQIGENPNPTITYQSSEEKGYTSIEGIYINNQTKKSVNLEKLLNKKLDLTLSQEPSVLILHTHTTESYTPSPLYNYIPTESDRSLNSEYNMISVGKIIAEYLNSAGINTIHDTSVNDYPSYSESYSKSLALAKSYMAKYPSIKIVIDVHRDAIVTADGVKMRPVASLENPAAQLMMVVGTNDTGLSHPNWETNLSFALKLQHKMNTLYPTLARPINLRRQRFNHHVAPYAFILEVGTNGNSLDEAKESARLFSECLISLLKS